MRTVLLALTLAAVPSLASAECVCTCIRGRAVSACSQPLDVAPLCQRICPEPLEQTLGRATLNVPGDGTVGSVGNLSGARLGDALGSASTIFIPNQGVVPSITSPGTASDPTAGLGNAATGVVGTTDPGSPYAQDATGVVGYEAGR